MNRHTISGALLTAAAVLPILAQAQVTGGPAPVITGIEGVLRVLNTVVSWLFAIFLVIAVIFVLIAAFKYLTSGGDASKVTEASRALVYAAVAIAVALLSTSIEFIVRNLLGNQGQSLFL